MKQLKIAAIAFFALLTLNGVKAQDADNPWAIKFGVNTVDFIQDANDFGDHVNDYLGFDEDWNILPAISNLTVERYLNDHFSLQLGGSINKIDNYDMTPGTLDGEFYWSLNGAVTYRLVGDHGWFDPYLLLGGSYTNFLDEGAGMLNAGYGVNFWFSDKVGLTFQSVYMQEFSNDLRTHLQHSLGVKIAFGGKDTDGDGIYDKYDECPETPGLEEFKGCPDSDGDGIKDSDDACPNEAGLAELNGCPDRDGDGIADKDDMCPDEKGTAANNGCPDRDGDGIVDKDDNCPDEAGPAANNGCPYGDKDGDGLTDNNDECPDEAGPLANNGCPATIPEEMIDAILFHVDKATFKKGVPTLLENVAKIMNQYPSVSFIVEGHTDSTGSESYNMKLSGKRAQAVKDYLVGQGVDESRLEVVTYGETKPVESNKTKAGRAQNRRVDIKPKEGTY